MPADELAAWIDELRRRLDAGELGGAVEGIVLALEARSKGNRPGLRH